MPMKDRANGNASPVLKKAPLLAYLLKCGAVSPCILSPTLVAAEPDLLSTCGKKTHSSLDGPQSQTGHRVENISVTLPGIEC